MKNFFPQSLLCAVLLLSLLLCGCGKQCASIAGTSPSTVPSATEVSTEPPATEPSSSPAIDVLISLYGDGVLYHREDFSLLSLLPLENAKYSINWSTDATEDVAVLRPGTDGTVTVDINELCQEDTAYTLTATVATAEGQWVSHSWACILPKAMSTDDIMEAVNALKHGQRLSYSVTLIGTVSTINKNYDADYDSITLTIRLSDYNNQAIRCYGLQGNDIQALQLGDTIAVKGILQKYSSVPEFDSGCTLVAVLTEETDN